jgi:FAD/FMN-containing dehydrogenase
MGGYLLGGGVGYNHDNWGSMACQSILAAEVVLASGETVIASPDSNADLYWAVRGSGIGFFGVVTRYKLQLYPTPGAVYESSYIFPLSRLADATALLQAWAAANPANTELMMLLAHNPMAVAGSSPLESKLCVVRAVSYGESPAHAQRELTALGEHPLTAGAVVSNAMQPTSLQGMAVSSVDASMGLGFGRYAVDTVWTDKLPEVMAAIADHFAKASSAKTHFVVSPKLNRELPDNAAFSMIGNTFVGAYTMWDEAVGDAKNFAWLAGASALMRPLAVGQYINEVDAFLDPAAPQRCFSVEAWKRLAMLRRQYDPQDLFYSWPGSS